MPGLTITLDAMGIPVSTAQHIEDLHFFCKSQLGCTTCPLRKITENGESCIYRIMPPAEVSLKTIIDLRTGTANATRNGLLPPGTVRRIGRRDFVIIDNLGDKIAVITKEVVTSMPFGTSGDYLTSAVREYCNTTFYNELALDIGADKIIQHKTDLDADDGTSNGEFCEDLVSLITMDRYRKYRTYIPTTASPYWTSTRVSHTEELYARYVCCVDSNGVPSWDDSDGRDGVRPFCLLDSSVLE